MSQGSIQANRNCMEAEKMRSGHALTDSDRQPWLQTLANLLEEHVCSQTMCVMACSCLKKRYRQVLSGEAAGASHADDIAFVSAPSQISFSDNSLISDTALLLTGSILDLVSS